jgi:hypothetical protein
MKAVFVTLKTTDKMKTEERASTGNRDSSVGIAMVNGLDHKGAVPGRARFLSSSQHSDRFCGQPGLLSSEYRAPSAGVKWPGCEADNSPLSSSVVKNVELYLHSPHMGSWRGALSFKYRDSFTPTLTD